MAPALSPTSAARSPDSDIENDYAASRANIRDSRTLESVSSLHDAVSGSITEIKVWSQPPERDTASPPVEPVSSQSSSSEESLSKERPRYSLPPSSKRAHRLKKSSSGRDMIVQTVSTLKEAASASISDLKEWAAAHTRSEPIKAVSSSASSSSASMVDSKPRAKKSAVAYPPSLQKTSSSSREMILESVSSLKDAANETMNGIKEWAAKLPASRESSVERVAQDTKRLYQIQQGENPSSPERATRTLYGAQTGYESTKQFESSGTQSQKQLPCSAQLKMMQDFVSPFLVCTSGAGQTVDDDQEPKPYQVDMTLKDRRGEPAKESAWANWKPIIGALDHRADSFDDSIFTFDSEAEEQEQIRRMTSWGTMGTTGTFGTQTTMMTLETARTLETCDGTMIEASMMVQDDHGNLIDPVLLEKTKRRREERKKKERKRLVKFDYPPISSLKECPRADPDDLPNLFFTEEELDQIEDDRYNTKIADDVEIVAISSIKSGEGISVLDGREVDAYTTTPKSDSSSTKPSPLGASFSKYASTPKLRGKRRSSSPFPRKASESSEAEADFDWDGSKLPPRTPSPKKPSADSSPPDLNEKRLIKGVQIFLRERSTGSRELSR